MKLKRIRLTSLLGISIVICVLSTGACHEDNLLDEPSASVTSVQLDVDNANFSGSCPHTFRFTATIITSSSGRITYRLRDIEDNDSTVSRWVDFSSAGSQSVPAPLEKSVSGKGNVILEIPGRKFLASNIVPISLICQ
jgi:hypothetical protein